MDKNTTQTIKEWHNLLQSGAITEDEFTLKKNELMGIGNSAQQQVTPTNDNVEIQEMKIEEDFIYKDAKVLISVTKCIIEGETFSTKDITSTSVLVTKSDTTIPWLLILGATPLMFLLGNVINSYNVMYLGTLIPFYIGTHWLIFHIKKKYTLCIHNSLGVKNTVSDKKEFYIKNLITQIKLAIDAPTTVVIPQQDELLAEKINLGTPKQFNFEELPVIISESEFKIDTTVYKIKYIKSSISKINEGRIKYSLYLIAFGSLGIISGILGADGFYPFGGVLLLLLGLFYLLKKQYVVILDMGDEKKIKALASSDKAFTERVDNALKQAKKLELIH